MPTRIIAIFNAAAVFVGLKPKPRSEDLESHIIRAINISHQSWVEKGWVEEKSSTKV